jgi:DNA-binding winged helix-turn-helix (wHTH) protein
VFSHEEIIDRLWPDRTPDEPIDIKQYVHLLRTKLAKVPKGRNLIENVKGFGYRLAV